MERKILYLTNIPAPYTVEFFNLLGERYKLTVLFEYDTVPEREKNWFCKTGEKYTAVILPDNILKRIRKVIYYLRTAIGPIIIGNYSSAVGILAIMYLKIARRRFYIHADGGEIQKENVLKKKIKRFLISSADWYFSPGKITDEYFRFYGNANSKILRYPFTSVNQKDVLPSCIPLWLKREKRRDMYNFAEDYIGIFVGSITNDKGIDVLLKAAANLNGNIGIHIFGGDITSEYEDKINKLEITNVTFHGFVNPDKILQFIRYADVMVFPTRHDVWGLVVNEALSQGVPVVTTDACIAGKELIDNGENGYIVQSENYMELARRVNQICSSDSMAEEMSQKCIERIKDYTLQSMAAIYGDLIEKCELEIERAL